ncbi:ribbon-helix-helix domain-containing protein, partial [Klebsiella pneumoniae]|uniref:ribbon-helix-helix domain-containing protein n=1 Tax=Klebsiella pneumoniae TaxID=573 RepID=UPI00376EE564
APSAPPPAMAREAAPATRYPKATTREGKRVVTAYVSPEAFRQLKRLAADTDAQQQDLLIEGINLLFEKHGLSRIA